jgi:NADH dehydrogenase [ubiquinone] 1 alpha subcomplex assembly factor 1
MKNIWKKLRTAGKETSRMLKMEHVFEPDDRKIRELFRFDTAASLDKFKLMTDADMGGKSKAEFSFDPVNKCAVFEGVLDLTPPPKITNSGFAAIVSREAVTGPWNLEDYDALMVKAKTDGRIYVANMRCPSVIEDDLWQSFMIGEASKWTEIVLPFSKFIITHKGFVSGQIEMDARSVETVGVLMAQRRDGPFRIEIASISAVNTDLYDVTKRWTGVSSDTRDLVN